MELVRRAQPILDLTRVSRLSVDKSIVMETKCYVLTVLVPTAKLALSQQVMVLTVFVPLFSVTRCKRGYQMEHVSTVLDMREHKMEAPHAVRISAVQIKSCYTTVLVRAALQIKRH
jgi:hypothetical protein